jgi:hypothetical protein
MAIQRTASISEMVVYRNTLDSRWRGFAGRLHRRQSALGGYTGYAGYNDDLAAFLV